MRRILLYRKEPNINMDEKTRCSIAVTMRVPSIFLWFLSTQSKHLQTAWSTLISQRFSCSQRFVLIITMCQVLLGLGGQEPQEGA